MSLEDSRRGVDAIREPEAQPNLPDVDAIRKAAYVRM
jgi:hypothetical protein